VAYPVDSGSTYVYNTTNNIYPSGSAGSTEGTEAAYAGSDENEKESLTATEKQRLSNMITPLPKVEPAASKPLLAGDAEAVDIALTGFSDFRAGKYEQAADRLFTATQQDPSSPVLKIYLAEALFSIGEYRYAAEYLRQALSAHMELAGQSFEPDQLYASTPEGRADFEEHLKLLKEHVKIKPYDADALLLLGFIQLQSGDLMGAGSTFINLKESSADPINRELAEKLLEAIQNGSKRAMQKVQIPADPVLTASATPADDEIGETLIAALY